MNIAIVSIFILVLASMFLFLLGFFCCWRIQFE